MEFLGGDELEIEGYLDDPNKPQSVRITGSVLEDFLDFLNRKIVFWVYYNGFAANAYLAKTKVSSRGRGRAIGETRNHYIHRWIIV